MPKIEGSIHLVESGVCRREKSVITEVKKSECQVVWWIINYLVSNQLVKAKE